MQPHESSKSEALHKGMDVVNGKQIELVTVSLGYCLMALLVTVTRSARTCGYMKIGKAEPT
eukprot:6185628-Pleurochrysis_carterae.AAC.1